MRVEFWQPMRIPTVTHNDLEIHMRKKGNKRIPFIGKSSELLDAEAKLAAYLKPYTPSRPLEGPLFCDVQLVYYDETVAGKTLEPKTTKPDVDNVAKTLLDVMATLGWFAAGDQQVFDLHLTKYRADTEGIKIDLREVER